MNVQELIEELQQHDPNAIIVGLAGEIGYDELSEVKAIKISLKANPEPWNGEHEEDENADTPALALL